MTGHTASNAIELRDDQLTAIGERGLATPLYDRRALQPRIVHIGVGGFHRAHLAIYCDRVAAIGADWGICGVGLLASDRAMHDALSAQDHLYTFTKKGSGTRESEVIGSIIDYVYAPDEIEPVAARIGDPVTRIVSMTVTESGYDDVERNHRTFDAIAAGLARRRDAGHGGITILSCDNLQSNGDAARARVLDGCRRRDDALATWASTHCTFPNSMVDRITPVTADDDRRHLLDTHGVIDRWPVVGEPFWQWVVEDDFADGRPDFASVGALFSDDVHAWEIYKLRMLNAGHSAIAYLSALAGIDYVDEALATPAIRGFLEHLLIDEVVPTIDAIAGHSPADYAKVVVGRFANSGVRDQIARLCVDGTSKFPTFLMPTVRARIESGGSLERCAHALAGWAHYLTSSPDSLAADSMIDRSRARALAALDDPLAFLADNPVFADKIASAPTFRDAFAAAHRAIAEHGALGALGALGAIDHGRG